MNGLAQAAAVVVVSAGPQDTPGWVALLLSAGIPAVVAGLISTVFLIGPQRRKYKAEATGTDTGAASTLSGAALAQMTAAIDRAGRAERKADAAERRADKAETRVENIEAEQRRERHRVSALRLEIRDLRVFLESQPVAALLLANGLHPPQQARVVYDSDEDAP